MRGALLVVSDRKHTETFDSKTKRVNVLPPRFLIRDEFPLEAARIQPASTNRHRSSVSFEKAENAFLACCELQRKHAVGNDAEFLFSILYVAVDFTWEEIQTLRISQRFPDRDPSYNGIMSLPNFYSFFFSCVIVDFLL